MKTLPTVLLGLAAMSVVSCTERLPRSVTTETVRSPVESPGLELSASDLAYCRLTDGFWQIWVTGAGGGNRQITYDPTDKRRPRWMPDGKRIAYRDGNQRPFVVGLDGAAPRAILQDLGRVRDLAPTNDPSRIVFARFRSNVANNTDLWVAGLDGEDRRILTHLGGLQYDPALSPDGKRITYVSGQGPGTYDLFICNADGSERQPLTRNAAREHSPCWSPDGSRIVYASDLPGNSELCILDLAAGELAWLTENNVLDTDPTWSPSGRHIAFTSYRSGELQVWIMGADGSDPRQLTSGAECREPSWWRPVR